MKERKSNMTVRNAHHTALHMSRVKISTLFVIAILLTIGIVEVIYFFYHVKYIKVYDATLSVEDNKLGINIDPVITNSTLDFGVLPPASSIKRDIIMVNSYEQPLMVAISAQGTLASFLSFEETSFVLAPGETKSTSIIATIPLDAERGAYAARIVLTFSRI